MFTKIPLLTQWFSETTKVHFPLFLTWLRKDKPEKRRKVKEMAQVTNQTMVKFINIIPTTKEQLDNYASIEESAFAKGPLFF
jgi:hypothetical protein